LYQLSYLGKPSKIPGLARKDGLFSRRVPLCLAIVLRAFGQPVGRLLGRDGVASLEPAPQVQIGAALGAEGLERRDLGLAAGRTFARLTRLRHRSPRGCKTHSPRTARASRPGAPARHGP